jgi:DNA ligase-1
VAAIEQRFVGKTLTFDGELYNHDYRDNFEDLMSLIRPPAPVEGHEVVQYWIYDLPSCKANFGERHRELFSLLHDLPKDSPLVMVPTTVCKSDADIWTAHERNLANEFEGTMIRNDGPYEEGRRSRHLQKLKTWKDGEYTIIGFADGRGKDASTVAAFYCIVDPTTPSDQWSEICENLAAGRPELRGFKARLKASYDYRRKLFAAKDFVGKPLTVKYQNLTADGKPRFPIGKGIRDYE